MSFDPEVGDNVVLNGAGYSVEAREAGKFRPFQMQGGKAIVFKLKRVSDGTLWAFKTFLHGFRGEHQVASVRRLQKVAGMAGLKAASQIIVPATDPSVTEFPEFAWAVLMPWIEGKTWGECLNDVVASGQPISKDQALAETLALAKLFAELEDKGHVHCDLSCGNVIRLPGPNPCYELIDLEDMCIAGDALPNNTTSGTAGYGLWGVNSTAVPAGDRYAAAIIILESLALATPYAATLASMEGIFNQNRNNPKDEQRFQNIIYHIKNWKPQIAALLESAWTARTLEDCPRIGEFVAELGGKRNAVREETDKGANINQGDGGRFKQEPPPIGTKTGTALPPKPPAHKASCSGLGTAQPPITAPGGGASSTKTTASTPTTQTSNTGNKPQAVPVTKPSPPASQPAKKASSSKDSELSPLGWAALFLLVVGWYLPQTRAWAWTVGTLGLVAEFIKLFG